MNAPQVGLSDLSVSEFLTLGRLGFFPRGLVVGVSFYDAGITIAGGWTGTRELPQLGQAMRAARHLAVQRLRKQAQELGAEGVVGVRIEVEHHVWRGGHTIAHFGATGTAVGFDPGRAHPSLANAPSMLVHGMPFTSDLSAAEFVSLMQSGYRPVTLAMGNCVMQLSKWAMPMGNVEISSYTQAFMDSRESAMLRLEEDLFKEFPREKPGAPTGVVGMKVSEKAHAGNANVVEFTAFGTAIAPLDAADPRKAAKLPAPVVVVPVDR
jgi:uncharacterized protein YbjQ (UPF0145 family)